MYQMAEYLVFTIENIRCVRLKKNPTISILIEKCESSRHMSFMVSFYFVLLCNLLLFSSKLTFSKSIFRNTIRIFCFCFLCFIYTYGGGGGISQNFIFAPNQELNYMDMFAGTYFNAVKTTLAA